MELYVIRRLGAWANLQELEAAGARRVGMPADQIFPILKTIVIRKDPAEASAAA